MAYYQIEPWGPERGDLQAGIIASTVYNMARGKNARAMNPSDFLPEFDREPTSPAELQAKIDAIFSTMSAAQGRKKR